MIENKKYFIDRINSSKANKMTALYHYSGVGFKKAILNLGIFRKEDNKMVGVLQFGCSYQEKIRLDRYVKEPIEKEEYLELNRFSMADSEGKNSESQAISLAIKWIKQNMPNVRLLVSYAGRKEGNYGYIYQATNWEYLGYFISEGFWYVDGEERHLATLWYRFKNHGNQNLTFVPGLCEMYRDVRKTWTKQFIYIMRLDKKLTPAVEPMEYPKPDNEFPIKIKEHIYKQDDDVFNNFEKKEVQFVEYYYEKDKKLFTRAALIRRGEQVPYAPHKVAIYDAGGNLEMVANSVKEVALPGYLEGGIRKSIQTKNDYKNKYFRFFDEDEGPIEKIEVPFICIIDEIPFNSFAEAGRYLGVSRQAIHNAKQRRAATIKESSIIWVD